MAKKNKSKKEILEVIEKLLESSKSFLMPMDFNYLVRGGRLSSLVGKIGEIVKLVPVVLQSEDGKKLDKFATKRTFKKAILSICEYFAKNEIDSTYKIYISHALNESQALIAKEIIKESVQNADIEMNLLTPAFTTQGGPGCISIQFIKKYNELG